MPKKRALPKTRAGLADVKAELADDIRRARQDLAALRYEIEQASLTLAVIRGAPEHYEDH